MKRIGIFGAGQLGAMLAEAGQRLGLDVGLYDAAEDPAAGYLKGLVRGPFDDDQRLRQFAQQHDLVTYEFENIPQDCLGKVAESTPLRPGLNALEVSCDRLKEKSLLKKLDIPTAEFVPVDQPSQLTAGVEKLGTPCLLKTRRFGYDGKGQWLIKSTDDIPGIIADLKGDPAKGGGYILEAWVPFDREVSLIGARALSGNIAYYDLSENYHRNGILRSAKALPGNLGNQQALVAKARAAFSALASELDYIGVLVVEFFERDGELLVNEFAPRVHNSGHWTIEGAQTCQFENHLRAIADLPLGATATIAWPFMVNIIGARPDQNKILSQPGIRLHDYGKASRPGRKLGHVAGIASSSEEREDLLERTMQIVAETCT